MESKLQGSKDKIPLESSSLYQKIGDRTAMVGVVGLGYVGLPTLVEIQQAGFKVTGFDISQERVDQLNSGESYIEDVQSSTLASMVAQNQFVATTDPKVLSDMDVIVICVPTPVNEHKEPELGPLQDTMRTLVKYMSDEQLIVLQSTTFPGTTEEMVLPQLQNQHRRVGEDFYLAFSPERIDPGNQRYTVHNIPKVIGGVTPRCGEMAVAFLANVVEEVIQVDSPKIAEMTKLLENTFRSVNIALVNELAELCQRMGIDIWEVIHSATTKPFGFMPFYPGIGVGGHCIPVDPFYLSWKAKKYDFNVSFIELAARTNDAMPDYAVSRIGDILTDAGIPLKNSKLMLLGIGFKKDIGDTRNSPALRVARMLCDKGAEISYSDKHVPEITVGSERVLTSVEPDSSKLQQHDATVILVNHSYFDVESIVHDSKLVIDACNATRSLGPRPWVVSLFT